MAKQIEENETNEKVSYEVDSKGIPVWSIDGNVIIGLKREDFFNDLTADNKDEAKKSFYAYMIEFKGYRISLFQEKVDALKEEQEDYRNKLKNFGKELSPKDKALTKLEKLKKMLAAQEKALAELS